MLQQWLSGRARTGLLFVAAAASAQAARAAPDVPVPADQPTPLDEIVVTAQKREQPLESVPVAVTVVTGDQLESANITAATDIRRLAPSLQYAENSSVRGTSLQVRGVGTQSFSNGLEQSVGTMVDGIAMARNGMGDGDLIDVDRVEVLRGPQGMLFGKNASAGLVSIVTRRPTDRLSAEGSLSFGTYNEVHASAVVNLPVSAQAAFRLAGFSNRRGGLVTNVFDGSLLNNDQESGLRAKFLWRSHDDNLQVYLSADWSHRGGSCCVATVRSVVPGSLLAASLASAGIVPGPDNRTVNLDGGAYSRSTNAGASAEVTWQLGGFTLTAWRTWKLRENTDSDATPIPALSINFGRSDANQWTQEMRLASPAGSRLEYVAGLYYFDAVLHGNNGQQGSLTLASATPVLSRYFIATNRSGSMAAFGQATLRVTPGLRLIAGARLTHDNVSMDFDRSFFPGTLPSSPPLSLHPSTSASNLSWRAGLQYDAAPGIMAYGTVSRGYKGPGFNALQAATAAASTPVRPEIPMGYEMGIKASLFERRLTLNLAAYDTRFKDFQAQLFDPSIPPFGAFVLGNAGVLRTRGVELEWAARPAAGLTFSGGVNHDDAVYLDFKRAACWGTPAVQPACVGGVFDASGVSMPNSPKWTFSVQGQYERSLGSHGSGFVSLNWYGRSKVNDSLGDPNMIRASYGLLGMSVGVSGDDGRWQVSVWVRNLLDRRYTGATQTTLLSPGSYSQYPVEDGRRMIGIAFTARLGD
jgi:iron complex outermembrane receptor protein